MEGEMSGSESLKHSFHLMEMLVPSQTIKICRRGGKRNHERREAHAAIFEAEVELDSSDFWCYPHAGGKFILRNGGSAVKVDKATSSKVKVFLLFLFENHSEEDFPWR
jgi:hypothetical protein